MSRSVFSVLPRTYRLGRLVVIGLLLLGAAITMGSPTGLADAPRKPLLQQGKKTIYERVLTQPGASLQTAPGQSGGKALPAMSILYVYARQDVGGASWIEVGPNADGKTVGWVAEQETLPWKQQLTLAFTNPAGRDRGLMFGQRDALDKLLMADKPGEEAAKLRQVIASGNVPDDFPVIAMEPQNYIDISKQFYLLPILEAQDAAMGAGYPVRELHIASVPADPTAGKAKETPQSSEADMLSNFTAGVVFVIDSTKSMDPYIDRTRQAVEKMYDQIQGKMVGSRAKFGLVAFRAGAQKDKAIGYTAKVFVDPNKATDKKTFLAAVKGLSAAKVSTPRFSEDSYAGIITALNDIDWSNFGARYIILVTDAGALDGSDEYSSTKLNADQVRLFAQERGVAVYTLHLLTKEGASNHATAESQYKTVSSYPNLSKPLYYPIAEGSVTQFGKVVDLLSQAIVEQVAAASSGKAAIGAEAPSDNGNSVESQVQADTAAVSYAMRLAYLGRVAKTTAPKLVQAWTVDRDFAKPDVATMDVRVLLTKNQLSDLQQVLKTVLDVGKAKQLDPTGFFDAIRSAAAALGRDPAKLKDPNATKLGQLGLIGEYIDDLPYKSKVMGIDQDIWQSWSISEQQFFLDEIERKLALYQKINDDADRWVALSPNAPASEYVYPIPIDALP